MKSLVIILAPLLVLVHPLAASLALVAVASAWAGLGWLAWRGLRAAMLPPVWRRAA